MRTREYDLNAEAAKSLKYGLLDAAEKIREVLLVGAWRCFETPMHRVIKYATFVEFVEAPRPHGLDSDIDTIRKICKNDVGALELVDKELRRLNGGDRRSKDALTSVHNIHTGRPSGTSPDAALRRLRDRRPDLHARVLAGELSPHAAAIEAGFRKRTITVPCEPQAAARTLRRHFDIDALIAELQRPT